jgi:polysaccharide biosynthesis/export protein
MCLYSLAKFAIALFFPQYSKTTLLLIMPFFAEKSMSKFIPDLCRLFIGLLAIALLGSSCKVYKPLGYFKEVNRDTLIANASPKPADLVIKPHDILSISISSLNKDVDAIFSSRQKDEDLLGSNYPVDRDGYIFVQRLGKLMAAGVTRQQLKKSLESALSVYLKEPFVNVGFVNHKVTVIGEVSTPQVIRLEEENMSILDVMAKCGSLTAVAEPSKVVIIRQVDSGRQFKTVNLQDYSVFSSPYFYLQPDDVVVISQNEQKLKQEAKREKYFQSATTVFQGVSLLLLIYQVFIRR